MKIRVSKYGLLLLFCLLTTGPIFGMNAVQSFMGDVGDWTYEYIIVVLGFLATAAAGWSMLSALGTVVDYEKREALKAQGIVLPETTVEVPEGESFLKKLYDKAWSLVPADKEKDILFDHSYDGIRELDNNLPPWWVAMFWGCIVIGVAYFSYYHILGYGESSREAYAAEMKYEEARVKAFLARQPNQIDENNVAFLGADDDLSMGSSIYTANCAACHGQAGEGGIGPNLTDSYWIHGGGLTDVFKTVKYGVPTKGMIAWKSQLRATDIQRVSSYIMTLQGTNPPNPKEPQGELYEQKKEVMGMK